ncbi:MAG: type I-F CRISPR-associated protein Csy3 [Chlamydiota bacterium]
MNKKNIKRASVLAFERKLSNSDALMFSGNWQQRGNKEGWKAISIKNKAVRGTISNLKNAIQSDPAKLDAKIQNPNLQRVDVATLPFDADTLRVGFSLRILGNIEQPSACDDPEYQKALISVVKGYIDTHGVNELALRYAANIANARFLWRNRIGVEAIEVRVKHIENGVKKSEWIFNCDDYSLRSFSQKEGDLSELAEVVRQGLLGESFVFLQVEAFARLGVGQEVFPSQELILDKKGDKRLYQVSDIAALHSQKIGNALRTIDTWYPESDTLGPIAVEPYGSVTNRGKAYRQPKDKVDFYTLLDNWVIKGREPSIEQQHYIVAILIRGGVFGEKG